MNIISSSVLLLTACVNPRGMSQTVLQDSSLRLEKYREAIRYYLEHTSFPIVVVENTGVDFSSFFPEEAASGRLECIAFEGNDYDRALGKGYGEGVIIRHAFEQSRLLGRYPFVIKATGSHCVTNLMRILRLATWISVDNADLVICEAKPYRSLARSDLFVGSVSFFRQHFIPRLSQIDEAKGVWFEHVLFDSVCAAEGDGFQFIFLPQRLDQRGISGTWGTPLKRAGVGQNVRHFFKMLLFRWGWLKLY